MPFLKLVKVAAAGGAGALAARAAAEIAAAKAAKALEAQQELALGAQAEESKRRASVSGPIVVRRVVAALFFCFLVLHLFWVLGKSLAQFAVRIVIRPPHDPQICCRSGYR